MELPKGLRLLTFDREKLGNIWEELRDFCWYLGDGSYSDPVRFTELFFAKDSVILESDYGYMVLSNIRPGRDAEAHLPFLDHKLSIHTDDVKAAMIWAFIEFDLVRLEAQVYSFQKAIQRFLREKLGFTYEGRMRRKAFVQGRFCDVEMYSILREEVFNG